MKIKFQVEIYEEITETHEVIIDKEAYEKMGQDFCVFEYISEDTLLDKKFGNDTQYKITKSKEIK
tara:strand:+ start:1032 stop:1226 length:195 start_codon:yes stop_codon:yes gene_type:complete